MHPVLFSLGPLEIRVYGVLTAVSFLAGIYLSSLLAKREGIEPEFIYDMGLAAIIGAVAGARLLYAAVWWEYYSRNIAEIFMVWKGGLVYYGGLIGAVAACAWYAWIKKVPILKLGDVCMPFLSLGHAIGRIGCYYNGCCYGAHSEKFGVLFPGVEGGPRIPAQLYESGMNFLNFLFLLLFFKYFKRRDGQVFFLYFLSYGIIRFAIEFLRGDPDRGFLLGVSTSTLISVFMIAAGSAGLFWVGINAGKKKIS